jgi:hypothetical protein
VPSEVDVDIRARLLIRFLALISPFVSTIAGAEELGARLREAGPGVELDVLPYATGGWYASLWYGFGHLLYVNPWAAGHLRVAGDDQALLGSRLYAPDRFVPEASVEIGWRF